MAIRFECVCGQRLVIAEEYAGRVVRCRQCGVEQTVPGASLPPAPSLDPGGPPRSSEVATGYVYKMVQIPSVIEASPGDSIGQMAASYLERVVNGQARQGWEFYRTDTIGVSMPPGCLGALFGERANTLHYYVITFRRPGLLGDVAPPVPNEEIERERPNAKEVADRAARTVTLMDQARERSRLQADEQAERDAQAKREAERESLARREAAYRRRTERDEAYRARGIEPGPMAWFRALPEVAQAAVLGAAIIVPTGIVFWLVILKSVPGSPTANP